MTVLAMCFFGEKAFEVCSSLAAPPIAVACLSWLACSGLLSCVCLLLITAFVAPCCSSWVCNLQRCVAACCVLSVHLPCCCLLLYCPSKAEVQSCFCLCSCILATSTTTASGLAWWAALQLYIRAGCAGCSIDSRNSTCVVCLPGLEDDGSFANAHTGCLACRQHDPRQPDSDCGI